MDTRKEHSAMDTRKDRVKKNLTGKLKPNRSK
jgi:hypothetical protein